MAMSQLCTTLLLVMTVVMATKAFGGFSSNRNNLAAVNKNISQLWSKVNLLSQPIEVHVHGNDAEACDSYFGCDGHKGHDHGSHSSHGHKGHSSHGHKGHKSHGHKGHKSHGHKGHKSHEPAIGGDWGARDNHIHIHLSVNEKKDCGYVSYAPKDEFVYARCDMKQEAKSGVKGTIHMRQKPHGILETKIKLRGFNGPDPGIVDGKHGYFFDVHDKADFTKGCVSFGEHKHIHHDDSKFDHKHNHTHDHSKHDHGKDEAGHDHSVHDHHADKDDWGNVIVNKRGYAMMEVNCTHHELYGPESMMGKGIVLHDKDDKLISCCAITYADVDDKKWEKM